jgi:ankyrin repeat protein
MSTYLDLLVQVACALSFNGFAQDLRCFPFASRELYSIDDLVIASKNVRYGGLRRTRLHSLARHGDLPRAQLLVTLGADVNAEDIHKSTPLLFASQGDHESTVQFLVEHGADVNKGDEDGWTPLHFACSHGHARIARCLLANGARADARERELGWTPLFYASENGHEPIVHDLVENGGASVAVEDFGGSCPIAYARAMGHSAISIYLMVCGALDSPRYGYTNDSPDRDG